MLLVWSIFGCTLPFQLASRGIIIVRNTVPAAHEAHSRELMWARAQRRGGMIKGIVGCRVRHGMDLEPILLKLKSHATQYQGFRGMENLLSADNDSVVAMLSTWERAEDWKSWAQSAITQELFRQAGTLLAEEPRLTTYTMMMPAPRWV
jgi:heme-degrading monooxygenase HmoA